MSASESPIGIRYLTEEEHVLRMARAIWSVSRRRVTLVRGWDTLEPATQEVFLVMARKVVAGIDWMRERKPESHDDIPSLK